MTKSFRARRWGLLAGTTVLALSTTTGALAGEETPAPPEEAPAQDPMGGPDWPPADTGGAWLPLPEEVAQAFSVAACDSTVTVSSGDVLDVEYSAMHQADGTVRVEYRGEATIDVTRESDGAQLDELDVSGPGYEIFSADGGSITFSWEGPSIIGAFDEVEAAVFAAQGLPPLFFYESGNTTERVVFSGDPEAETIESAEFLTDTALGVADVCDLLDQAQA